MTESADGPASTAASEIISIEGALARLKQQLSAASDPMAARMPAAPGVTPLAMAKLAARMRRIRDDILGATHFGEPAWDILLELFVACGEARPMQVSSVCLGTNVPPTTALRWITALVEAGVIVRARDPNDRRRAMLALSPSAMAGMTHMFETMAGEMDDLPRTPGTAARVPVIKAGASAAYR